MSEVEFKEYTVTCKTQNCQNAEIAIKIMAPVINPNFICGPCGQAITHVV
jgi:hypothetical protein